MAPAAAVGLGESLFQMTFEQAQHPAAIVDCAGVLRHVNKVACALVGQPASALVGHLFWETPWWTHSSEEQAKLRDAIPRALRGERAYYLVQPAQQAPSPALVAFGAWLQTVVGATDPSAAQGF